jgi:DNA polymerase III subunit alpha
MAGDERVDKLIGIAKQLEGVSRHASTHAAGIVISREPLTEIMPLQRATDGKTTMTQFEMHACEALGLLKFDFLGLINLTILADAVDLVEKHRGIRLDVDTLPLDDAKTFELLGRGDTMGVFQLEGSGMRRYVKELKPTEVRDLAAMVALFRPGPMANIPAYIRRKHGEEPVSYLHPALEPALKDTYGIFVYQEDIMTAAIAMADYTGPEADNLCYAIRKKKEDVLRQHEAKFKAGARKKGIAPQIVDKVFAEFEPFARYGFNKAHATCYGLIAYQTAYLKANYPIEFMTAVLNGFRGRAEKVAAVIAECRHLGIEVLPPDVHRKPPRVHRRGGGDPVRSPRGEERRSERDRVDHLGPRRGRPFRSLTDFCTRIDLRLCNRKVLEALAKVGALKAFGHPGQVLLGLDDAIAAGGAAQRDRISGQTSLFDLSAADASAFERPLPTTTEVPVRERLRWEKELLGSTSPSTRWARSPSRWVDMSPRTPATCGRVARRPADRVGGIVTGVRSIVTKAKASMAIVTIEDLQGSIEVVVFPRLFEQSGPTWTEGRILLIAGRVDHRGEEVSILADLAADWDEVSSSVPDAFAREVAALERVGGRRRPGANGTGNGVRSGNGASTGRREGEGAARPMVPVGPGMPAAATVSPLRTEGGKASVLPSLEPATPVPTYLDGPADAALATDRDVEPAVPDEARERIAGTAAGTATVPLAAADDAVLHVRFARGAAPERLVGAMEMLRGLLRDRPGSTKVVIHVPIAGEGSALPMELRRGVAYDSELLAEVSRRLGEGVVDLSLA